MENTHQLYADLKGYALETWVNNAGFGNYDSVAQQDLEKIEAMLHLNVEALTSLSSLFVRDCKDVEGTKLINISSCGGYTIVPTFLLYALDGLTYEQIARLDGCSKAAIQDSIEAVRKNFRKLFKYLPYETPFSG